MSRPVHIACLQTRPMASMVAAIDEALPMVASAAKAGAKMLFLPEYCGGLASEGARIAPPSAPEDSHAVLAALRSAAVERKVWMMIGSIAVDGPDGRIINRGYMVGPDGAILGRYDKLHLFDVELGEGATYRESDTVQAGQEAVLYETPMGRIGHTICYDLRFPGLFRDLAQAGAEVLACPAAFTRMTGEAHWHLLNRARAVENTRFVISACAVGSVPGGGETYGHSLVVDPWGNVLADGGTEPGVVHAEIDLDLVPATSQRIPSLSHDQTYRVVRHGASREAA